MSGIELTGEDFHSALKRSGINITLDEADEWFDKLKAQSLIDLNQVYNNVVHANDIEEELALLEVALDEEIKIKGIPEIISSTIQERQLEQNTLPAKKNSNGVIRL